MKDLRNGSLVVTSRAPVNILHLDSNCLQFKLPDVDTFNTISLVDQGDHNYLSLSKFGPSSEIQASIVDLICSFSSSSTAVPFRPQLKRIIDRVHRHACGHSNFEDIKLLLERNKIWTSDYAKYLSHLLEECQHCAVTKTPSGSRPVSLSSMSRIFNDVVCLDHFFPDNLDVLHIMDAQTRYSAGSIVPSTSMSHAIPVFESQWMSQFWPPDAVQADKAFDNNEFQQYLKVYDVSFRPIQTRRHSKNVLESKHRILRDIYLRLKSENPSTNPHLNVARMFRISNDLYGNDVASATELAKGYTRPLCHLPVQGIPQDILDAQNELQAKRKLNNILRSNAVVDKPVHVGDLVQFYTRLEHQKRGTWSYPQPVLQYDVQSPKPLQ